MTVSTLFVDQPAAWKAQLEEAERAIETLPFVNGKVGYVCRPTGKPSANKVFVNVSCCWSSSRRSFQQIMVGLSKDKPTHLEALHALNSKLVAEHGGSDHVHDHRALEHRARFASEELTIDEVVMAVTSIGQRAASTSNQVAEASSKRAAAVAAQEAARAVAMEESGRSERPFDYRRPVKWAKIE